MHKSKRVVVSSLLLNKLHERKMEVGNLSHRYPKSNGWWAARQRVVGVLAHETNLEIKKYANAMVNTNRKTIELCYLNTNFRY